MKFLNIFIIFIGFTQSESVTLDCRYEQNSWTTIGSVYQCTAKINLLEVFEQIKIERITGKHEPGKTNRDVEFLEIKHQNLQWFPKGIEQFFPNLKGIRANNNDIKVITKDDLKVFPKLQYFDFFNNELTMLDGDLFSMTPNLQYIDFNHNKIKKIGKNTFKSLINLQYLYFNGRDNCVGGGATSRTHVETLVSLLSISCGN